MLLPQSAAATGEDARRTQAALQLVRAADLAEDGAGGGDGGAGEIDLALGVAHAADESCGLVVAMARSPWARQPLWPPRHGAAGGGR